MNARHNALVALLIWLGLGVLLGLAEWPYQLLSELGFVLQRRLWLQAQAHPLSRSLRQGLPFLPQISARECWLRAEKPART